MTDTAQPTCDSRLTFQRSPLVLVPTVGLLYSAIFLAYFILGSATVNDSPLLEIFVIPLCVAYSLTAVGIWVLPRMGYAMSISVAILSLVLFGIFGYVVQVLGAPVSVQSFVFTVTIYPTLLIVLLYSFLGFRKATQARAPVASGNNIPSYNMWGILIVGFIIGGLVVGVMTASVESRLLAEIAPADITIVMGSAVPNTSPSYSPSVLSVRVGQTVTWVNRDTAVHSVTSSISNIFDSGRLDVGSRFQVAFTKAGDYDFYCIYHSWMNGEITVT